MELTLLFLFAHLTFTVGEDSVTLSHGIYLHDDPTPYIHTDHFLLSFLHQFSFTKNVDFSNNLFDQYCAETKLKAVNTSFGCVVQPIIKDTFDYIGHRLDTHKVALTGSFFTNYNITPFKHPMEIPTNLPKHRAVRQVLAAASFVAGAMVTTALYSFFGSTPTDHTEELNKLSKDLEYVQAGVVTNNEILNNLVRTQSAEYNQTIHKFNEVYDILEQTMKEQNHLEELYHKSLRMYLLIASLGRMTAQLSDLVVFQNNLLNCQNGVIPPSVLSPATLQNELLLLRQKLFLRELDLSIPPEHISVYYKAKLCSCHIEDNTITLHIKIPIRHKNIKYRLLSGTILPFKHDNQICQLGLPSFKVLYENSQPHIISNSAMLLCDEPNELCKFNQFTDYSFDNNHTCIKYLLTSHNDVTSDITKHCPFHCSAHNEIIIINLRHDTYALTNIPVSTSLKTFSSKAQLVTNLVKSVPLYTASAGHPNGVIIQKLFCNTQIYFSDSFILRPSFTCSHKNASSPIKEHVILYPYRWTNQSYDNIVSTFNIIDDLKQDPVPLSSVQDVHTLQKELKLEQSSFYSPKVTKYIPKQITTFANHFTSNASTYLLYINLLWSLLITIAVFFLIGRTMDLSTKIYGMPLLASLLPKANALSSVDITHHFVVFIATIVIIDILILGFFMCLLFFYLKLKWSKSGSGCMYYKCPKGEHSFSPQREMDFEAYTRYRDPVPASAPVSNIPLHTLPKGLQSRLYPDPTTTTPLCLQTLHK